MPVATIYPKLLDTDTELLRMTVASTLSPEDHNNLVDAIQAVEGTIGIVADGTEGGGAKSLNTGLATWSGYKTTAVGNLRFPYLPLPANAWYASARVTPVTWTIAGGAVLSYAAVPGLVKITTGTAGPQLLCSANLIGSAPWDIVVGAHMGGMVGAAPVPVTVGFSVSGLGADCDGGQFYWAYQGYALVKAMQNGAVASPVVAMNTGLPQGKYWLHHTGAALSLYASMGEDWVIAGASWAATGTPTKLVIYANAAASPWGPFYLDFITQGNVNPPHA